ncbi:hypothetical protein AB1Y20_020438 [Prymnesium parvum]|uniref:V-type proton ATPase subunit S1/VOA1 transmembrane domain-containing protein n=1 Tax=Prymnesium parvum TaxID=97485 RepID=A0AB34JTP4_PRYPA
MAAQLGPLLTSLAATALVPDFSPAFLWSPRPIGVGRGAEHLHETPSYDLERAVAAIAGRGKHPLIQAADREAPELQLIFLAPELTTEAVRAHGGSLKNLENLMKTSASSLSIPFTTHSAEAPRLFDGAHRVEAGEADAYFRKYSASLHDSVPNTVVVELKAASGASVSEALRAHDELIGRVSSIVEQATGGQYTGLLASMASMQTLASNAVAPGPHGRLLAKSGKDGFGFLHMTPTLLTAYLICFLLFVIFLNGFCCLFSLQTPRSFPKTKKDDE